MHFHLVLPSDTFLASCTASVGGAEKIPNPDLALYRQSLYFLEKRLFFLLLDICL